MGKIKEMTGEKFGRLTVLRFVGINASHKATWLCECDCGNTVVVDGKSMRSGNTKSCGCFRREDVTRRKRTHGRSYSKLHFVWCSMRQRCTNNRCKDYPNYGGRGITICERWSKFENFLADMGEKSEGLSLDREDNNGNYSPENCRWATIKQQNSNKRPHKRGKHVTGS